MTHLSKLNLPSKLNTKLKTEANQSLERTPLERFLFECRQHSIEELKNLRAEIAEDFQKSSSYKQQWGILDRMGVQKNIDYQTGE